MPPSLRVLLIGEGAEEAALAEQPPGGDAPSIARARTCDELRSALRDRWDIAICVSSTGPMGAPEALHAMREAGAAIPLLVMRRPDQDRLDEQTRLTQKMDAAGRLAGSVAHDFNNFLTVIDGYSDLLLSSRELQGFQRSALEEIRKSAQHAADLTRQLLAFSRRQHLKPRAVGLSEMAEWLEQTIRPALGGNIELEMIPAPAPGLAQADLSLLAQAILNLVANAREAMPSGGKLTVEITTADLSEGSAALHSLPPGSYAVISISDSGSGMNRETLCHLFEPYFTTKNPGRGTGLGLATAYGIIRQSGGAIEFHSELGKGTTARVYLPAQSPAAG